MFVRSMSVVLRIRRRTVFLWLLLCSSPAILAQEPDASEDPPIEDYGNESFIGSGGNDLTNQLIFDASTKDPRFATPNWDNALRPWYDWKASLFDRYGFQFTLAYSALAHFSTETRTGRQDKAAGGVLDFGRPLTGDRRRAARRHADDPGTRRGPERGRHRRPGARRD